MNCTAGGRWAHPELLPVTFEALDLYTELRWKKELSVPWVGEASAFDDVRGVAPVEFRRWSS